MAILVSVRKRKLIENYVNRKSGPLGDKTKVFLKMTKISPKTAANQPICDFSWHQKSQKQILKVMF
jgi:hypothetical protein